MTQRRATLTVAPNFAYSLLARKVPTDHLAGVDLSSLRAAVNGAEPVDPATAEAFAERFGPLGFRRESYLPVYGLAEATLSVTVPPPGRLWRVDIVDRDALASGRKAMPASEGAGYVSVGSALDGHGIQVVDPDTGHPLPERCLGEIVVRGPSVSPGYFGEPPRVDPDLVHTGDLGYVADGELFVVDRLKDLVIIAGRSYAPSDIERAAETVEGVRLGRSVAFGVPLRDAGTDGIVLVAEARGDMDRVRDEVERAIGTSVGVSPAQVLLVAPRTLMRTSSGKIMRRDARERYLAGMLRPAPRSRTAQALREALFQLRMRLVQAR
jgi:acyl-CoA synthetase (AMP-forming)/AMP-acid ligase II